MVSSRTFKDRPFKRKLAMLAFVAAAFALALACAPAALALAQPAATGGGAPAGVEVPDMVPAEATPESRIIDSMVAQTDNSIEENANFFMQLGTATLADGTTIDCMPYTGEPVEPQITGSGWIGFAGMELVEGKDFTVSYENNVEPGEARAIITGIGSWSGMVTHAFRIEKIEPNWQGYGVYGNEFGVLVNSAWQPPTDGAYRAPDMIRIVRANGAGVVDVVEGKYIPFPSMGSFYVTSDAWGSIEQELEAHVLKIFDEKTSSYGLMSLDDGKMLVDFGKYNWMSFGKGLSPVFGTWIDGENAGIDYFDDDFKAVAHFTLSAKGSTATSTYIRYGGDEYPYDTLSASFEDKAGNTTSKKLIIEKTKDGLVRRDDLTEAPAYEPGPDPFTPEDYENAPEIDPGAWWSTEKLELADGTKARYHIVRAENGIATDQMVVVGADDKPIVRGGATLGIYPAYFQKGHGFFGGAASANITSQLRNSAKHAGIDMWWATDKNGKWGVIDSAGNVIVPFEYEAYGDRGLVNTDSVLVKKDGAWSFFSLKAQAETPEGTQRLAGNNALGTMADIVGRGNFKPGGTVVLAQLEGYWDALTAAGIAGLEDAPVLMTTQNALAPQTEALLKELAPAKIVVCGGDGAVPQATVDAAAAAAGTKPQVVRCAGDTAVGTAIDIYQEGTDGKGSGWTDTALIATVGTFQDALAAAPVAYAQKMPIFLASYDWAAEEGTLSAETVDAMVKGGIKKAYIAGGTYWISDKVQDQLKAAKIEFGGRLSGGNAMQTSEKIANLAVDELGMGANGLGLATVNSYYDALCGAALCGRLNSVMLLVDGPDSPSIAGFVKAHAKDISGIWVYGGDGTVSKETLDAVNQALGK